MVEVVYAQADYRVERIARLGGTRKNVLSSAAVPNQRIGVGGEMKREEKKEEEELGCCCCLLLLINYYVIIIYYFF